MHLGQFARFGCSDSHIVAPHRNGLQCIHAYSVHREELLSPFDPRFLSRGAIAFLLALSLASAVALSYLRPEHAELLTWASLIVLWGVLAQMELRARREGRQLGLTPYLITLGVLLALGGVLIFNPP